MNMKEKYVIENIYSRRSVRSYVEGKQVEEEKIEQLLKAAMAAPSACNIQPWEFIVVNDDSTVKVLRENIDYGKYNAPLIIVVCGNPKFIPWDNDNGEIDCSAATENMILAATAMDLGSVWIGGFDPIKIRSILDIPEEVEVISIVYVGYPKELPEARTKYIEAAVHYQKYDRNRVQEKRPGCLV